MSDNKKDADGKTLGNASLKVNNIFFYIYIMWSKSCKKDKDPQPRNNVNLQAMLEKAMPMLTFRNSFSVVIVCWLAVLTLHQAGEHL